MQFGQSSGSPPGAVRRRREVAAAAEPGPRCGGGAGGGVPEGRGGRGLRGIPAALRPPLRPHPLQGSGQRGCSSFSLTGWSPDTDTGGSGSAGLSGACPFPQLLRGWEFPAALAPSPSRNTCPSRGCKQHFSLLAVTAGFCESPALSVDSFRCSGLFTFQSLCCTLTEPRRGDTEPRRGDTEPATAAARGTPDPGTDGRSSASCGIPPSLRRARCHRSERCPALLVRSAESLPALQDASTPRLALLRELTDGCIYGLGGKPEGLVKHPTGPGPAPARGSDTSQTRLWACEWPAMGTAWGDTAQRGGLPW